MAKRKKSSRKKGRRRSRPITSFKRRESIRQPRERILIVCEGDKTEPKYFESLRAEFKLGTVIVVEGGEWGSAPISVVDYALSRDERVSRRRKTRQKGQTSEPPFGEVWCVFDVDQHESFHRAVDKARANGLELVVSNPAFEYWYLLHFRETDRPFADASEVIKSLKVYLPDYDKGDVFDHLFDRTDEAVGRARRILANCPDQDDDFPNPSTLAFKLVEKLKSMSNW